MFVRTCSAARVAEARAWPADAAMLPTRSLIDPIDSDAVCIVEEISAVAADCFSTAAAAEEKLPVISLTENWMARSEVTTSAETFWTSRISPEIVLVAEFPERPAA